MTHSREGSRFPTRSVEFTGGEIRPIQTTEGLACSSIPIAMVRITCGKGSVVPVLETVEWPRQKVLRDQGWGRQSRMAPQAESVSELLKAP